MTITCPDCGHHGNEVDFALSLSDEAFCPQCGGMFLVETQEDDDEDEDEEEGR